MKDKKLDEQVLGFASLGRLQKLAGIPSNIPVMDQIDEADEESKEETDESVEENDDVNEADDAEVEETDEAEELTEDEFDDMDAIDSGIDDMDPMADAGAPGDLGAEPVEEPFDPEMDDMAPELDSDPGDDIEPDMGDDMVDMGDLPAVDPAVDPMTDIGADMGMDMGTEVVGDVRSEIESSLDNILTQAPNLKIADFKDVLHHAEEVVAQVRAMGAQFLKEGAVGKRNGQKTLREAAKIAGGFRSAMLEANTKRVK